MPQSTEDCRSTARNLCHQAQEHLFNHEPEKAEPLFKRALALFEAAVVVDEEEDDCDWIDSCKSGLTNCAEQRGYALIEIADAQAAGGDVDGAAELLRKAFHLCGERALTHLIHLCSKHERYEECLAVASEYDFSMRESEFPATLYSSILLCAKELTRQKKYDAAIQLVNACVEHAPRSGKLSRVYDEALYQLGLLHERRHDLKRAKDSYEMAIQVNSENKQVYKRYAAILCREGRREEAVRVLHAGIGVTDSFASQTALRRELDKLMKPRGNGQGMTPNGNKKIQDFRILEGAANCAVQQYSVRPQITLLALDERRQFTISGGSPHTRLIAWRCRTTEKLWEEKVGIHVSGMLLTDVGMVLWRRQGRNVDGTTRLLFYSNEGDCCARQQLESTPTQLCANGELVFVGCHDGGLYAFSLDGTPAWRYQMPELDVPEKHLFNGPPCPYYLASSTNAVVFASFNHLFALDMNGALKWRWTLPDKKPERISHTIDLGELGQWEAVCTMSGDGLRPVKPVHVSHDGVVTLVADGHIYSVADGNVDDERTLEGRVWTMLTDSTGAVWVAAHNVDASRVDTLICVDGEYTGKVSSSNVEPLAVNSHSNVFVCGGKNQLLVGDLLGNVICRIECTRPVRDAHVMNDGAVFFSAGHLFAITSR